MASMPAQAWRNTSRQVIGTTPAQVAANFNGVIHHQLSSREGAERLAKWSEPEMQALAYAYAQHNGGNAYELHALLQAYSPKQAARFLPFAHKADAAWREGRLLPAANGAGGIRPMAGSGPNPTLDMTIEDIYLEYRTAAVGSLSVSSSIYMTTAYVGVNLYAAFQAGYTVGQGISWLIQTYAPSLDNAIGATLFSIINSLEAAGATGSAFAQGLYENKLLSVYNVQLSNLYTTAYSGQDYGDWGTVDAIDAPLCLNYC